MTPEIRVDELTEDKKYDVIEAKEDDVEITEDEYNPTNKNINQYLESMDPNEMEIVLSEELGLAI